MPLIYLTTFINAPINIVFDTSRSIDVHMQSMEHTNEKAVAGRTTGLAEAGDTITWEARHLGRLRRLEVRITAMQPYSYFEDRMMRGDFAIMRHQHYFNTERGGTVMKDVFYFEAPYGFAGRLFNKLYLEKYMKGLLRKRNDTIKTFAESNAPLSLH